VDPLRVLVVADDPLARAGLAALLAGRPGLAVAGQAAPEEAGDAPPHDAAVVDLGASGSPGPDRLRALAAAAPVVALVADDAQAADALRAGARALLGRSAAPEALAAALAAAARGLAVLDAALADAWLRTPGPVADGELTPREREVLDLLAEGLGNKVIAARLGISDHTAKFHVNAILGKLGAESRAEAIVKAARRGLVAL
jgi:DNA-binding NarL/FixJ family response regulator